ncbi:hypothetical protein COHA_007872 [Chlorella ohadii]|uniref:MYND-type domain-containing protein n=1 Tax=Chlorella ohadii TaxID=2649997 RepID=A0AAD5DIG7_9CHLO|nr:hypothetical protein COHA_007872 [Chlorella ohadii]
MSRPRPKFVRLHPADNPSTLNPVFFGHPDEFVPQIDETTGRIERWGIVDDDSTNADAVMYRIMSTQMMYGGHLGGLDLEKPEVQFVDALIARKERALQAGKAAAAPLRDYIIDVDLALYERDFRTNPRVWRRIRVSGGTSLEALQDKVLTPAMQFTTIIFVLQGWTRNYHGSVWCDHRDGTMFGDPESGAIDMMHVGMHYYAFVDQRPWHLADLLQEEGQHLSWTYDIGDKWRHMLTVVQILPEEESNGRVQVLEGAMACPPEDSKGLEGMGPRSYQEFLDEWADPKWRTSRDGHETLAEASAALNYRDTPGGFQPERFSVAAAQRAVDAALASRASVSSGAKQFCVPLQPGGGLLWGEAKRGQEVRCQPQFGGGFMQETVATGKDARSISLCGACGSPHNLQICSGCKLVRYCSKECQKNAWSMRSARRSRHGGRRREPQAAAADALGRPPAAFLTLLA